MLTVEQPITDEQIAAASDAAFELAERIVLGNQGVGNAAVLIDRLLAAHRIAALEEAAGVAYRTCAETRHVTLGDKCAAAIRALKGPQ